MLALVLTLSVLGSGGARAPQPVPQTFSARAWAARVELGQPQAWALSESFDRWFPAGVVLGDTDGVDGDAHAALVLRTPEEVTRVLSSYSRTASHTLLVDREGARGSVPGELVKEALTTKLNVAYDDEHGTGELARYVCGPRSPEVLSGMSVMDLLALADRAISGEFGHAEGADAFTRELVDVDGDGVRDLTLVGLADTLQGINLGFSDKHQVLPNVTLPRPEPEPETEPVARAGRAAEPRWQAGACDGGAECTPTCSHRELARLREELQQVRADLTAALVEADRLRTRNRRLFVALEEERRTRGRAVDAVVAEIKAKAAERSSGLRGWTPLHPGSAFARAEASEASAAVENPAPVSWEKKPSEAQ